MLKAVGISALAFVCTTQGKAADAVKMRNYIVSEGVASDF